MWFDSSSVAHSTNPASFSKGLHLLRIQAVLSWSVHRVTPEDPLNWRLSGTVQGSRSSPYELDIEFHLLPDHKVGAWVSQCSCPMAVQCKHGVALMLKAAYLRLGPDALHLSGDDDPARLSPEQEAQKAQELAAQKERAAQAVQRQRIQAWSAKAEQWLLTDPVAELERARERAAASGRRPQLPLYLLNLAYREESAPAVLRLKLVASSPKVKGGWSKPHSVVPSHFFDRPYADLSLTADDRDVLALLGALPGGHGMYRYGPTGVWLLNTLAASLVLKLASQTERLFWEEERDMPGKALRWGAEQVVSWHWHPDSVDSPSGDAPADELWRLRPELHHPQAVLCANNPMLYLDLLAGECGPVADGASEQQQALLSAPPLPARLMRQHETALLRRLGPDLPPPPVLPALRRVGGVPVWRLHLSRLKDSGRAEHAPPQALLAKVEFDYQGVHQWWDTPDNPALAVLAGGERVRVERDLASERQARHCLQDLGLEDWQEGHHVLPPSKPQTPWLHWAQADFQVFKNLGFVLSMDEALQGWLRQGGQLAVDLSPQSQGDQGDAQTAAWFDMSLGLELHGQRINLLPYLPHIIAELRLAEQAEQPVWPAFIYLPDANGQGFLQVGTEPLRPWLNALLELFDERGTDLGAESLRLSRMDALRTQVALGEGVAWQGAQGLRELAQRLQGLAALPTVAPPQGLHAQLWPYQQHGLDWLQFLREAGLAGILADDMGLGKTLQTLAHIQVEKEAGRLDRPALVLAPVSVLGNWLREAQRFCPELRCLLLHGAGRHELATDMAQADVVIAPYSLVQRDRERWLAQPWHLLVLDEAHHIKNAATHVFQVVTELHARHRLCLTGTPIENHLGELWSLFHFLMPGFLGSQTRFTQRFRTPIEKRGDSQRMTALRARVTPFILRRHKQDVATELPPKVETVMPVEISGAQANLYETIRLAMEVSVQKALADKGLAKSQIAILDALLKLRQVCCDPRLVKSAAAAKVKSSAKLEQLMEMLPEMLAEGRRILLFSQFTTMLGLIEVELAKRNLSWVKLTGATQKRDEVIERFTSGEVPLFLISLKAGGVGLNLPQADTVIHFDPWWNPAAENQATDRAHRIGQTQSVWVIKLVAQGTIEERILALQERKAQLARELYSGAVARKQPLFTEDDLQVLLRPLG